MINKEEIERKTSAQMDRMNLKVSKSQYKITVSFDSISTKLVWITNFFEQPKAGDEMIMINYAKMVNHVVMNKAYDKEIDYYYCLDDNHENIYKVYTNNDRYEFYYKGQYADDIWSIWFKLNETIFLENKLGTYFNNLQEVKNLVGYIGFGQIYDDI